MYTADSFSNLRKLRILAEKKISGKKNFMGTMLGVRIKKGIIYPEKVLTVFVCQKTDSHVLSKNHRIPKQLKIGSEIIRIDILPIQSLILQNDLFPSTGALTANDGVEFSTLTAFAKSPYDFFGMTCAHALGGFDKDPYTQSPVSIWSPLMNKYISVGNSALVLAGGGTGIPGSYGFADIALFTLIEENIRTRAQKGNILSTNLVNIGETVFGSATSGVKTGEVIGIEMSFGSQLIDILVKVKGNGTFRGDSGMLWKNSNGEAVAIHAKGSMESPGIGSSLSACMSAVRAEHGFNIKFIE